MSMKEALAPHLPYLRRYGRALTGSQERGDSGVRATLAALLSGERSLDAGVSPKVGLYRNFQELWAESEGKVQALGAGGLGVRLELLNLAFRFGP